MASLPSGELPGGQYTFRGSAWWPGYMMRNYLVARIPSEDLPSGQVNRKELPGSGLPAEDLSYGVTWRGTTVLCAQVT